MKKKFFQKNKIIKKILIGIGSFFLISVIGFLVWTGFYYKADEIAIETLKSENVHDTGRGIIEIYEDESESAIIFYPGAKVEYTSYLPLLERVATECDVKIFLVNMPLNLAFLNADAAESIIGENDDIKKWYLAGHSLGGGMASDFASKNQDKVDGLIVLGAYIYGDYPPEEALTVYGTFNLNLEKSIDYTENIVVIEGGNHAQFGNYGKQDGDPDATISAVEQQEITSQAIKEFLNK